MSQLQVKNNMDPFLLQKQVRDNSEDIRTFLSDLKSWEKEMKRKDQDLSEATSENHAIPPVRSKIKRTKQNTVTSTKDSTVKRISSYDYSAWDKFDVEKACADVDKLGTDDEEEEVNDIPFIRGTKLSSDDKSDSDVAKLQEQALYEKELGNDHVKNQRWLEAIACYSKAIECNPYDAIFYANRALCYLKTKKAKFAEMDCTSAIRLDSSYVKAYQRRALARVELQLKEDARADFKKVLELEPNNVAAKNELAKLDKPPPQIKIKKDQKVMLKVAETRKIPAAPKILPNTEKSSLSSSDIQVTDKKQQETFGRTPGAAGDAKLTTTKLINVETISKSNSFSPSEDEDTVIPINKPPHLRSKKPLRLVSVEEVESMDELHDLLRPKEEKTHKIQLIEEVSNVSSELEGNRSICKGKSPAKTSILEEKRKNLPAKITPIPQESTLSKNTSLLSLPPAPTSSVQFFTSWKTVKHDPELRFQYLKLVPGIEFPRIFLESLESKEFSEILSTLATDFIERLEPVYSYLLGLSQVKRFSALVMFLSKAEKAVIKKLIQYCMERNECSPEEIDNLKKMLRNSLV